ncbi:DUF3618 domain-containing protein [Actinokineospora soli]|uniref:DUF3618 domain-containing protein n=1 Tax=Actinokineospora soli TaxID=1048753 RepID=A0ABW2TQ87_9PSEU
MTRKEDLLREDIKQARAELADTVEALVAKTDVKRRAAAKVGDLRTRTVQRVKRDPVPLAVGAALGIGAVGALVRGLTA